MLNGFMVNVISAYYVDISTAEQSTDTEHKEEKGERREKGERERKEKGERERRVKGGRERREKGEGKKRKESKAGRECSLWDRPSTLRTYRDLSHSIRISPPLRPAPAPASLLSAVLQSLLVKHPSSI